MTEETRAVEEEPSPAPDAEVEAVVVEEETSLVPAVDPKTERKEADNTARMELALAAQQSLSLERTHDLNALIRWGKVLAASGMFNDIRGPAQAIVKVLYGRELGLTPMQALTGIYFFSGKLELSCHTMAALIKSSQKYDYRVKTLTNERAEIAFYERFIRNGEEVREEIGVSTFTMADAQQAKIVKGVNWMNYPRNMLYARAMSNGFKWFCGDLAKGGAYVRGEISGEGVPIDAEFTAE